VPARIAADACQRPARREPSRSSGLLPGRSTIAASGVDITSLGLTDFALIEADLTPLGADLTLLGANLTLVEAYLTLFGADFTLLEADLTPVGR
jgi:hypothetical protein